MAKRVANVHSSTLNNANPAWNRLPMFMVCDDTRSDSCVIAPNKQDTIATPRVSATSLAHPHPRPINASSLLLICANVDMLAMALGYVFFYTVSLRGAFFFPAAPVLKFQCANAFP
jgi:hypothetical protein